MSSDSYEVKPITSNCKDVINDPKISPNPGTPSNQVSTNLDTMHAQQKENTRYDTVNMNGGKKMNMRNKSRSNLKQNKYIINRLLNNKQKIKNVYYGTSDIEVIKKYKKDNKIEKDCFVYINDDIYLIKSSSIRRIQ